MSSLVISGDTSGTITLAVPSVSGTNTATLPAATGTVMVSGNMPAFSVYATNAAQSCSQNTENIVQFTNKNFDTASAFNTSTYKFTAPVAGYYQFNISVGWSSSLSAGESYAYISKNNGGIAALLFDVTPAAYYLMSGSATLQANANDYFQVIVYQFNGSKSLGGGTTFSGSLIRTA